MFLENNPQSIGLGTSTLLGDGTKKLTDILARFANAKSRSDSHIEYIQHLLDNGSPDFDVKSASYLAAQLSSCGEYLRFNYYYTVGELRLSAAHFCKIHLLCPFCAIRRAAKATKVYYDKYKEILASQPNLRPYLLTYTVRNGCDLTERYLHLKKSWQLLLHSRRNDLLRGTSNSFLSRCAGGVYSLEFTHSLRGWHPHIHLVVLLDPEDEPDFPYLEKLTPLQRKLFFKKGNKSWAELKKKSELSREWDRVTGDSFIVDFKPIRDDEDGESVSGFCEVFKYALKFQTLSIRDTFAAYFALSGCRLTGTFGCFRGVEIPEDYCDELLQLPYIELFFHYLSGKGYTPCSEEV